MKHLINILMCAAALFSGGLAMAQQNFPTKPITLIVPFPAGGPADTFARELANGIGNIMKQPVLVENVSGAGGTLGVDRAAKATPDGYTWALSTAGGMAIAPFARNQMPYDPLKDLALVTLVAKVPEVLVINPAVPASNLKDLIAYLKANPGKLNFGSSGGGSITHLAGELLKFEAKVDMVHVPYKGAAPALTDLLGNQVQLLVLDVPVVQSYIQAGKLKAIAITSSKRVASLPDVPAMAELGFPKVNSDNWFGLVGNAKIPLEIQQRMNAAAVFTLKLTTVAEAFGKFSAEPAPSTSPEFRKFLIAEQAKWGPVIKAIGFKE